VAGRETVLSGAVREGAHDHLARCRVALRIPHHHAVLADAESEPDRRGQRQGEAYQSRALGVIHESVRAPGLIVGPRWHSAMVRAGAAVPLAAETAAAPEATAVAAALREAMVDATAAPERRPLRRLVRGTPDPAPRGYRAGAAAAR
jgi:hypothetical protein